MKELKFKTNINCGGCIAKVKTPLDSESKIASWEVDTASKDKILTVKTAELSSEEITALLLKVGFKAEEIDA